tara:strand:- start:2822 stop:3097 length:276 start_codon:yes stop_codon:yes gene_type:complete
MELKKTHLIKDKILMLAFSNQSRAKFTYKIFVFDMAKDYTWGKSYLTEIDAITPNFEILDYFYKNELSEQECEKMFDLDWNFLKKTWEEEL